MSNPQPSSHHHHRHTSSNPSAHYYPTSSHHASSKHHSHPLYIYLSRDENSAYAPRDKILDPRTEKYIDLERYKEIERERDARGERYLWEEGREERERELRRVWGREGKLGRRRAREWGW
ncbi:hypothetical protein HYALB_00001695 [Hymenoscyphus albidus]|uniref:Uncharacterized protein n=1 Tax=Hymenoscyphus albidus TaxID=595503 RepID=A0A9N9LH84_9HELO|nr:hypothetical protein HYALB_00001695 [Hymenoscyphus albidus]